MMSFTDRLLGAARLDVSTYEEVEADGNATGRASRAASAAGPTWDCSRW
jgi:hypothetical protein